MSPVFSLKRKKLAQIIYKEESVIKLRFYPGFYFIFPKMFNSNTPDTIRIKPSVPSRLGTWLYLKIPNKVTAVIVNAPYDAYAVETGIMLIDFDKQNKQIRILVTQKIVG